MQEPLSCRLESGIDLLRCDRFIQVGDDISDSAIWNRCTPVTNSWAPKSATS